MVDFIFITGVFQVLRQKGLNDLGGCILTMAECSYLNGLAAIGPIFIHTYTAVPVEQHAHGCRGKQIELHMEHNRV